MKLHELAILLTVFGLCAAGAMAMRRSASPETPEVPPAQAVQVPDEAQPPDFSLVFAGEVVPDAAGPGLTELLGTADVVVAPLGTQHLADVQTLRATVGEPELALFSVAQIPEGEEPLPEGLALVDPTAPWRHRHGELDLAVFTTAPDEVEAVHELLAQEQDQTFTVVLLQWGKRLRWASDEQREQAHALVDAGADLVVGHGAHMMQQLERYEMGWIAYGLGDLLYPESRAARPKHSVPYSMALRLSVRDGDVHLQAFPILPARPGGQASFLPLEEIGDAWWALIVNDFAWRTNLKLASHLRDGPLARHVELLPAEVSP